MAATQLADSINRSPFDELDEAIAQVIDSLNRLSERGHRFTRDFHTFAGNEEALINALTQADHHWAQLKTVRSGDPEAKTVGAQCGQAGSTIEKLLQERQDLFEVLSKDDTRVRKALDKVDACFANLRKSMPTEDTERHSVHSIKELLKDMRDDVASKGEDLRSKKSRARLGGA